MTPSSSAVNILVTGEAACFRRPEFIADMISYDVMPPIAALRLLTAAHQPSGGKWDIRRLRLLNTINWRWQTIAGARGAKRAIVLTEVRYVITACLPAEEPIDRSRLASARGRCEKAFLGLSEFPATLSLLGGPAPRSPLAGSPSRDLGWMVYDHEGVGRMRTRYFRPQIIGGDIDFSVDGVGPLAC